MAVPLRRYIKPDWQKGWYGTRGENQENDRKVDSICKNIPLLDVMEYLL